MLKTHLFASLTDCFAEYELGALVVTRAMLLRLINCRLLLLLFITIIISKSMLQLNACKLIRKLKVGEYVKRNYSALQ